MTKILTLTIASGFCFSLNAQTSEGDIRLKKRLERFPEADANKDGVLTMAEARAFQKKQRDQRGARTLRRTLRKSNDLVKSGGETIDIGLKVGDRIPELELVDQTGKSRDFDSLKGPKGLYLVFHRSADW